MPRLRHRRVLNDESHVMRKSHMTMVNSGHELEYQHFAIHRRLPPSPRHSLLFKNMERISIHDSRRCVESHLGPIYAYYRGMWVEFRSVFLVKLPHLLTHSLGSNNNVTASGLNKPHIRRLFFICHPSPGIYNDLRSR